MRKYATVQSFGGQRASCGRSVGVKINGEVCSGEIVSINDCGDIPIVRSRSDFANGRDSAFNHNEETLPFAEVHSESDIAAAPNRCWFWHPRV